MRSLIVLSACAMVFACTGEAPDETGASAPDPAMASQTPEQDEDTSTTASSSPAAIALPAGEHCFFRDGDDVTEGLEITVPESGAVSGSSYGSIHQDENAYYASFDIELTGGLASGDGLIQFDAVTRVDGDTQTGTMTWSITPDAAAPEGFLDEPMQPAACEGLADRVFPPPGEE